MAALWSAQANLRCDSDVSHRTPKPTSPSNPPDIATLPVARLTFTVRAQQSPYAHKDYNTRCVPTKPAKTPISPNRLGRSNNDSTLAMQQSRCAHTGCHDKLPVVCK